MQYIQGKNREQSLLFPQCLEQIIDAGNDIRLIDLFVESINMADFNFVTKQSAEGRPAYNPKDLLKLFIYGYLNSIRSSRVLEKQCRINIEVMWLMKELCPDHNTISNFRRDNHKAIRQVFKHTLSIAKHFNLIGGKLIAGDSTKLRAQNSKKNNFNEKKIIHHTEYIEKKLDEYTALLADADDDNKAIIQQLIVKKNQQKEKYNNYSKQLIDTNETQISSSDPGSRQMITRNNITEVAYNIQTTVDAKHSLTLDYKVTNTNDTKAMGNMVRRAKTILQHNQFTALFDKGYHTGSELKYAQQLGITTLVAVPGVAAFAPDDAYNFDKFIYNEQADTYTCPQLQTLHTNGNWYVKSKQRYIYYVKHYKTNKCLQCPALPLCTLNKKGRLIERSEYQPCMELNKKNIEANKTIYNKRAEIIEHTYGIIKRQWGFYYITTKKGIKRASADVGLMFTAFNLRRIFNIVGQNALKKFFQQLCLLLFERTGITKLICFQNMPRNFSPTFCFQFTNAASTGLYALCFILIFVTQRSF